MKSALVTGAGSGIGRSICLLLESKGFQVYAVGRRMEKLVETQAMAKQPTRIELIQADITLPADRTRISAKLDQKPLHYLIHNAGVVGPLVNIAQLAPGDFSSVMQTNVEAPIFLTQLLLPSLERAVGETNEPARILHVSSGCAHSASPSWLAYCVSKAAFLMAAKCLAMDLAPKRILVGSFKPGIVDTEMQAEMRKASAEDFPKVDFFKKLREEQLKTQQNEGPHLPSRDRLDTADNVAHFAWFLLSQTTAEEFASQDWDIRDEANAKRWT